MKTFLLGGIKSGKSRQAEKLANTKKQKTTLIATATALDPEMSDRIHRHRKTRNPNIRVVEEPIFLANALDQCVDSDCIIIDCLTLWITNLLMSVNNRDATLTTQKEQFISSLKRCRSDVIIVSNESNMGVIPMGELSRQYCDEIGLMHQELATICDNIILMVAGIPLPIKPS